MSNVEVPQRDRSSSRAASPSPHGGGPAPELARAAPLQQVQTSTLQMTMQQQPSTSNQSTGLPLQVVQGHLDLPLPAGMVRSITCCVCIVVWQASKFNSFCITTNYNAFKIILQNLQLPDCKREHEQISIELWFLKAFLTANCVFQDVEHASFFFSPLQSHASTGVLIEEKEGSSTSSRVWRVTVTCRDRCGLLSDLVSGLTKLPLSIQVKGRLLQFPIDRMQTLLVC